MVHAAANEKDVGNFSRDALESYGHALLLGGIELSSDDVRHILRRSPGPQKGGKKVTTEQERVLREVQQAFRSPKILVWDSPRRVNNLSELTQSYVMPITRIEESWDSLVCSGDGWVNAVQFIRKPNHGIKTGRIQELLQRTSASPKKVRVVHAVLGEKFDDYGWQPWIAEKAAERVAKTGDTVDIVVKTGVLAEVKVPVELESIEQWVVRLKLPEPGSDAPNLPKSALPMFDNEPY